MGLAFVFGVRFSFGTVFRFAATLTLLSALSTVLLSGCEGRVAVDNSNIDVVNRQQEQAKKRGQRDQGEDAGEQVVEEGLTIKEVEAVLGSPQKATEGKTFREFRKEITFTTWAYERNGETVELSFIDGKLQGKVPRFGEKMNPQAPLHMKKQKPAPAGGAE